ncbi:hypothetical protein LCGC14_0513910 [marine sediment metagenome]|uniref:Uncharacterized protein n=1 Tax=marine sediment metagenome TaxID=412755 RepID=A0A0F9S599_9ZZZZ
MGYVHEFSCDRCKVMTRNETGDNPFSVALIGLTRVLLCPECRGQYDDLLEANRVTLGATLGSFLQGAPVTETAA